MIYNTLKFILRTTLVISIFYGLLFAEIPFGNNMILVKKNNYFKVLYGKKKLFEKPLGGDVNGKICCDNNYSNSKKNVDFVKFDVLIYENNVHNRDDIDIVLTGGGFVTNIWKMKKKPNQYFLTLFTRDAKGTTYQNILIYFSLLTINIICLIKLKIIKK